MDELALRRYDLNLLPVLATLLRTRSTTETAAILARTQPGISRDLAKLRQLLGDPLFVRVRGRLEPTAYALSLELHLQRALDSAGVILTRAAPFNPLTATDTFHVGSNSLTENMLSAWMAKNFPKAAPSVSVRFTPVPGSLVPVEALETGGTHLAVGRFNDCPPSCRIQPLFTDQRVCVMREGHPMAGQRLTVDMLTALPFVTTSTMHGQPNEIDTFLAARGLTRRFQFFVSNLALAPHILLNSDCVTTLPRRAARLMTSQYRLAIAELPSEVVATTYSMIWSKRWDAIGAVQWLRAQVVQAFSEG